MNNKAESYVNDPRIRQAAVDGLIKLISYPSVSSSPEGKYPFGRPVGELLDHVLSEAEKKGFEAENHDYYCGSLLLKGKGDKEIGILSHLDVVPAGNGWSFEPFKGIFDGNVIIGRGACDNKPGADPRPRQLQQRQPLQTALHLPVRDTYPLPSTAQNR